MTREAYARTGEAVTGEQSAVGGSLVADATREGVPRRASAGDEITCRLRVSGATARATLVDRVPGGWPVRPVRATAVDPGRCAVVLGEVVPGGLGDGRVFEYRLTVPDPVETGACYAFGPTEAVAIVDGEWASETVAAAARTVVAD